jgi:predicted ATP-grasp superfamily ATP-dependent carboligase
LDLVTAERLPALVLGLSPTGLTPIRSLGRRGIEVYGADFSPWSVGRFSRYCTFVPKLAEASRSGEIERLVEALRDFSTDFASRPVLFLTNDRYIEWLTPHTEDLKRHYRLTTDLGGVAGRFLDKADFYGICREAGVDLPRTYWPDDSSDVRSIGGEITFPAIVKPARGHRLRKAMKGQKVALADGPDTLLEKYETLAEVDDRLLVQEVIPGSEDRIQVAACYFDADSEPRALFVGRKLRQHPPDFGSACLAESDWDEAVARLSVAFLRKVGFSGVCGTEFKLDPRDGRRKMIEVNPRLTLWMGLTMASGVDIPYVAYQYVVSGRSPEVQQQDGVRWAYLARDLQTSARYLLNRRITPGTYLRSIRDIRDEAVFATDDWGPALGFPAYVTSRLRNSR